METDKKGRDVVLNVPDKKVVLLLHDHTVPALVKLGKDPVRGARLSRHAHCEESLEDPEFAYQVAVSVVRDLERLATACAHLTVIPDRMYTLKEAETRRHHAKAMTAINTVPPKFGQALKVTDCIMKLIISEVAHMKNVDVVYAPAEAEAMMMKLLSTGQADVGIVTSGDSDVSIYASRGIVVICPDIQGSPGGRARGGRRDVCL